MKTYKDFIIYKGQDKEVQIPFAVSGFTDFTASFYTDKEYEILKTAEDFDFDGEWASIFFDNTALDLLNDGVLRYTFNYKIDGVDVVKSTNSAYTLRTPENYSAHTADEVYQDGYSSGYTDGMVSGTSVGYEEGFEEGEEAQKAKMTGVTITENGVYTRPDGYSNVDVNVDQVGPYDSGYTSGFTVGHISGVTEVENTIQDNSVQSLNFWHNEYTPDDGYESMKKITLNVQDFYSSAYTEGMDYQRSFMTGITITENGEYERGNGYSAVTVNVPTGSTIHNQNKSITADTNGHQTITFDNGYTGLGTVDIEVNVPGDTGKLKSLVDGSITAITANDLDNITEIRAYCFSSCWKLKSVEIPTNITEIGQYAFDYCSSLSSITIPNSVTKIGDNAFHYCTALSSVVLPSGLTEIANSLFLNSRLTGITIPDGVTRIGLGAFAYNLISGVTIPSNVTEIGPSAFYYCTALDNVIIPSGVSAITSHCFADCHSLSNIIIPEGVSVIDREAFANCNSLTAITLPSTIRSISPAMDESNGGWNLDTMYLLATTPPSLPVYYGVSSHIPKNVKLYVPNSSISAYTSDSNWAYVINECNWTVYGIV